MTGGEGRPFVVLDVDDTVVETFGLGLAKCRRVATDLGLPALSAERYAEAYGRMSFAACVRSWYPDTDVSLFSERYDTLVDELPPVPIGDLPRVVAAARDAGFGVGVLTNGTSVKTARKLAATGVDGDELDFVRTADDGARAKPHRDAFDALVAEGVQPERSWYVSDAAADWAGSVLSGFRSVGVVSAAPTAAGRRVSPDLVVPNVDALAEALAPLAALAPAASGARPVGLPRAIGFDVGFTLLEDVEQPVALVLRMLAEGGVEATRAAAAEAFAASTHWLASSTFWADPRTADSTLVSFYGEVLLRLGGGEAVSAREVVDAYVALNNWRTSAGAADAVDLARRTGVRVGFLSNWQAGLSDMLVALGLATVDDVVVSSAEHGVSKPSTAAFEALARCQEVDTSALVYVGDDAASDAAGALAAGCRAVLVPRGSSPAQLRGAVAIALGECSQPAPAACTPA